MSGVNVDEDEGESPRVWVVAPLYPTLPPTIAFASDIPPSGIPWELSTKPRPYVKFTGVGNNVVKAAFKGAGFKRTTTSKWNALWSGGALQPKDFKGLLPFQKVNHFPGTWELGRKDKLYRHLSRMRRQHPNAFNFLPKSFLLPEDAKEWASDWERNPGIVYIQKPRNLSRGRGVRIVRKASDIANDKECIVQHYVLNPDLIDGFKYDLRLYVLVTSFDPLRAYLYKEGLVRFATEKYRTDDAGLKRRFAHVTNYSVNCKNRKYVPNSTADEDGIGSKWSLSALRTNFEKRGVSFDDVWLQIRDVVAKTLIAVEAHVNTQCQINLPHNGVSYELYGFDIVLDSNFKPWLLEVNTGPALQSPTALDKRIKYALLCDTLHLVGFVAYKRSDHEREEEAARQARLLGTNKTNTIHNNNNASNTNGYEYPKRRDVRSLETLNFSSLVGNKAPLLVQEGESEWARRGNFERVFPTCDWPRFESLFEVQRYNNVFYGRWLRAQHPRSLTTNSSTSSAHSSSCSSSSSSFHHLKSSQLCLSCPCTPDYLQMQKRRLLLASRPRTPLQPIIQQPMGSNVKPNLVRVPKQHTTTTKLDNPRRRSWDSTRGTSA